MFDRTLNFRRSSRFCFSTFLSAMSASMSGSPRRLPELPVGKSTTLFRRRAGDSLARLDLHVFAFVADAFALIRLGLADTADVAGELADQLFVRAAHVNLVALDFHDQ